MLEDPRRKQQLQKLIIKLGLPATAPVNWKLLDLALIHPSISTTHNYEQLEFVGDAVIRLVAAELLLETYPNEPVGEFAAIRSIMVSDRILAGLAERYGIEPYLIIGTNATGNPIGRQSWLADAFEAVLGALYLSTYNMDLVRPWLDEALKRQAEEVRNDPARQNYKDALQEWTQGKHKILPTYKVTENPNFQTPEARFISEVWLRDRLLGKGLGGSKKRAEQAAAKEAFFALKDEE
ncbi:Ribonuclease 3 2 [Hyella patelloides LEGE 07179]|uniref:Ribonuclease 3 n=1 Tax=Hyella patelloides LEGE 07179 TaxID=945734 RepID=A0A563VTT9_9CYAN|nr:ribonuclease III [Hyella patelloides]VEP14815.1 Ribonuclease 3 2 [Hyella patelloides LEGE 07179]